MAENATIAVSAIPLVIDLKQEVQTMIAPYTQSQKEPPFSQAELSIMAWVCCKNSTGTIREEQMSEWVVRTFDYYMKLAAKCVSTVGAYASPGHTKWTVRPLRQGLAIAVASQEMPLYPVIRRKPAVSRKISKGYQSGKQPYACTMASARTFLRRTLGNETQSFSRFFDLPAEIRVMIYREVFYHEASIEFLNPVIANTSRQILRATPYHSKHMPGASAFTDAGWTVPKVKQDILDPSSKLLSLLLVNRQAFEEAMPVFYKVNTFVVRDVCRLVRMLRLCGERRRAHFTRIQLSYSSANGKSTNCAAAKLLTQVKHLQHLIIDAGCSFSMDKPLYDSDKEAWTVLCRGVGLRSINFMTECPVLEAFVREIQAKMKDPQGQTTKRKQKQRKRIKKSIKA